MTGGVSTWIHQYMTALPQHEFVIWAIASDASMKGKFKYTLPSNVVEVHELFLNDALKAKESIKRHSYTPAQIETLRKFIDCDRPDWETLFAMYQDQQIEPLSFLMSHQFLDILTDICKEEYTYTAFSDFFHTIRSMFLPVLYTIHAEVPKADLYHSIATGYSGILARLGSYKYHAPYMISEHGIYTREREEEIIRAKWVIPAFKKFWVRFFYMLSAGAYEKAGMITSLFAGARKIQVDLGCDPDKCIYIGNGIHYEQFEKIGPKTPNGFIDIGAVLRIAPIKDVKTMIYAFSGVKYRVPNARLFIAGPEDDKKYAQECYDLVERLGVKDIYFLGMVNVVEKMVDFDFTVLSSISEGMPLSVLESFAAGRPAVTTDVGNCKELVTRVAEDDDLGSAGYCVPPMDIRALTDAMARMCLQTDKRYQMGIAARERVQRYFRHEDMMSKYLAAYDEVLKRWQE